jgi:hypothetical protein
MKRFVLKAAVLALAFGAGLAAEIQSADAGWWHRWGGCWGCGGFVYGPPVYYPPVVYGPAAPCPVYGPLPYYCR